MHWLGAIWPDGGSGDQGELSGGGLRLRAPRMSDFRAWRDLRVQSAGFLVPWEPRWPADDLTFAGWRRRMRRYRDDARAGQAVTWLLLKADSGELLGGASLSNLRLGAARSGNLGYWMGARHAGHGYMTEAVKLILADGFTRLGLSRIEAACIPGNHRSERLLQHVGFRHEGTMRAYLEINGERRDHHLYAILKGEQSQERREYRPVRPLEAKLGG